MTSFLVQLLGCMVSIKLVYLSSWFVLLLASIAAGIHGCLDRCFLAAMSCCQMCLEYMVNHISPGSPQFQDYKAKGDASAYRDMFVRWKDVWASGGQYSVRFSSFPALFCKHGLL